MAVNAPVLDVQSPERFGPEFFRTHCGPLPYDRSEPHWSAFFGTIADELIRSFRPRRVFDAGCAHGFLVEALWDRGVEAWGRDVSPFAISQVRPDIRPFCRVGDLVEPIEGSFDLIVCLEVLEHMEPEAAQLAIAHMTAAGDTIVFSSSPSDFDEPTRVNIKPPAYWLQAFRGRGYGLATQVQVTSATPWTMVLERLRDADRARSLAGDVEVAEGRIRVAQQAERIRRLDVVATENDRRLAAIEAARVEAERQSAALDGRLQAALQVAAEDRARAAGLARAARELGVRFRDSERDRKSLLARARRPWKHFLELASSAFAARRKPNAHEFDAEWYRSEYADLRSVADPWAHFVAFGRKEARFPSPQAKVARLSGFDPDWYVRHYPDVAGAGADPLKHFYQYGRHEGRFPNATAFLVKTRGFDPDWYVNAYPEVVASGQDPAQHVLRYGMTEGRFLNERDALSSATTFDAEWYAREYPDILMSGSKPWDHWLTQGRREGRYPTARAALLRQSSFAKTADPYDQWIRDNEALSPDDVEFIGRHIDGLAVRPLISVVVPIYNTDESDLKAMVASVRRQLYPDWELCLADDASTDPAIPAILKNLAAQDPRIKVVTREVNGHICAATNSALAVATGEFVALLDHDDLLADTALYEVAVMIDAHPDAQVIYSDSDNIDENGLRFGPYFKTDWNPDLMLGHNMVSHLGVYRRSVLDKLGGLRLGLEGSQDYDLMLRVANVVARDQIHHIPAILYHWRRNATPSTFSERSFDRCVVAARRAIRDHLRTRGVRARIDDAPDLHGFNRVRYELPDERPLVSVIIPTRDRADLLSRCVDGVLNRTDYDPLEVIVVDNESVEPETLKLFDRLGQDARVRVIRYEGAFNFAAMNNRAVEQANGSVVALLNNDVDVMGPLWLEELVSHALRPEVGAVGAKLLYPDGRVQHAGIVTGVGHGAGHFFHFADGQSGGYYGFLGLTREVSAVTAACLVTRRDIYMDANGLDEEEFPVAFNDVDFCLRLRKRGLSIVWTPHAELVHDESATRGSNLDPESLQRLDEDSRRLKDRWGAALSADPFYNLNCSTSSADFSLGSRSRRTKPWLSAAASPATVGGPSATNGRADMLMRSIEKTARIFEFGPSYNPVAPKGKGWKTTILDHASRDDLIAKYALHDVDVTRIEDVDVVWTGGPILDAVPADMHATFDAFIASHVIEHTTDMVGFLATAEGLLKPTGVAVLAIPDKRYCFDYLRPLTTTGQILEAAAEHRDRHARRTIFDHLSTTVTAGGAITWGQSERGQLAFASSLAGAMAGFQDAAAGSNGPYMDAHAWQFTPSSFALIMLELARLGLTDLRVDEVTPATGCEFYAWLRRGGRVAAAALDEGQLNERRLALHARMLEETQEQLNFAGRAS